MAQLGLWLARDPTILRLVLRGPASLDALQRAFTGLEAFGWGGNASVAASRSFARGGSLLAQAMGMASGVGGLQLSLDIAPKAAAEGGGAAGGAAGATILPAVGVEVGFAPTHGGGVAQRRLLNLLVAEQDERVLSRAKWRALYTWLGEEPTASCVALASDAECGPEADPALGPGHKPARPPSRGRDHGPFVALPWRAQVATIGEQQVSLRREVSHIKMVVRGGQVVSTKYYLSLTLERDAA